MSAVRFFGQHLVDRGLVTPAALDEAVAYQAAVNVPLGALALSKRLLSERQVLLIHTEQRRTDRRFGELAVQLGFLKRTQLDELLREQAEARILIGEALVQRGRLTRDALDAAFAVYRVEQQQAEDELRRGLAAAPGGAVVQAAADITTRLLLRMAGLAAKLTGVAWDRPLTLHEHTCWQRLEGDDPLVYVLTLADAQALALGRRMLEPLGAEAPAAVDGLVRDVLKEFVNIVSLQLCARLGRDGRQRAPGIPEAGAPPPPTTRARVVVDLALPAGAVGLAVDVPSA